MRSFVLYWMGGSGADGFIPPRTIVIVHQDEEQALDLIQADSPPDQTVEIHLRGSSIGIVFDSWSRFRRHSKVA